MDRLPKVGCYEFLAEPFHCDFSSRLFLGHLGNNMLNAADYHSNERGYGINYLTTIHRTWVLSRLAIEMETMPKAYERFNIETWVESCMRFFTSRNFAVIDPNGNAYGYGRSVWAMIDTVTRQPTDILSVANGTIMDYVEPDKPCPIAKPSRAQMSRDAELVATIDTHYNDVDINGHINSVKYIEHVLDLFSLDYYRSHFLKRFEIAYVAESHGGDQLLCYREETAPDTYNVRLMKRERPDAQPVEVVRSKAVFIKK